MNRIALALVTMASLAACGGGRVPSYDSPEAMSTKAWAPAGITSCGGVGRGGDLLGTARFVDCNAGSSSLRFIVAENEADAEAQVRTDEAMGLTAAQRGSWVVAGDSEEILDRAVAALS